MKKQYQTPSVALVRFQYRDQVVATSGGPQTCQSVWVNMGDNNCSAGNAYLKPYNNQ